MSAAPLERPGAEPGRTIFQKGAPGRRAFVCPDSEVPEVDPGELLPAHLRRSAPPAKVAFCNRFIGALAKPLGRLGNSFDGSVTPH